MIQYQTDFIEFANPLALVEKLTAGIRDVLSDFLHKQGRASLAVSGGTTPGSII